MAVTWDVRSASHTPSNGDLTLTQNSAGSWAGSRSSCLKAAGKWYWEILFVTRPSGSGIMAGWSHDPVGVYPGHDSPGWGTGIGDMYSNGSSVAYGTAFVAGDVMGIALDLDNGKIFFAKNNTWIASGNPVTGANPAASGVAGTCYPAVGMYSVNGYCVITGRFKVADQSYAAPSGFLSLEDTPSLIYQFPGASASYDKLADPADWRAALFNNQPPAVQISGGVMTDNAPIDVVHWSVSGVMMPTGMETWSDCLKVLLREV